MAKKATSNDKARQHPLPTPKRAGQAARLEKKAGTKLKLIARKLKRKAEIEHDIEIAEVELFRLCEAIRHYAESTRTDGEFVVHLPKVGSFEWDKTKRTVILTDTEDEAVTHIEETEGLGADFLRIKKTVNKEAFENSLDTFELAKGFVEPREDELFTVRPVSVSRRAVYDPYECKWGHKANDSSRVSAAVQPARAAE